MVTKLASLAPNPSLEQAPFPVATVEGPSHVLTYVNSAFCRLVQKDEEDLLGKPFREAWVGGSGCVALLNRVYGSGNSESYMERDHTGPAFWSYTMWPVIADETTVGVMIHVIETAPLYEETLAINEALVIGSLRQHELTAAATLSNAQLQTETRDHKQRELDARKLTNEISHRIKNNLQIVVNLIETEAKRAPALCAQGYEAMHVRIGAIASLYDLMSQSSHGQTVALDAYLRKIARAMSESLLGSSSNIQIKVEGKTVDIDPDRAVPFGLLVNELATNAVKHAFPRGTGSVVLSAQQIGDQIELVVADDGVGMKDKYSVQTSERHGADYVAIFVRQLGGTLALAASEGTGTIVRIRFPLIAGP
jgi:two-component sensor histidine kinase